MLCVTIMSIMLNVIMLRVIYSKCPKRMQHDDTQHNNKTVIISVRIKPIVPIAVMLSAVMLSAVAPSNTVNKIISN
jgi:hypothetical protein